MLPPSTTLAYSSSSNMHNQLAFPPLTPASGMSTQELLTKRDRTQIHEGRHPGPTPMTDTVVEIADLMTGIIVDAVDPMTDILVSAVSPRTDIVGRGADLVTVIIASSTTPTTYIATSQDP